MASAPKNKLLPSPSSSTHFSNYDDVEVFIAIYQQGTLLQASKSLGHNPSVLARRLERLENFLHEPLFYKSPKGYTPTPFGTRYYKNYALLIQNSVMKYSKRFYEDKHQYPDNDINISMPMSFLSTGFTDFFLQFLKNHPTYHVTFDLSTDLRNLNDNQYDFVIRIYADIPKNSNLVIRKFQSFQMLACATPEFLDKYPLSYPKDLESVPCITPSIQFTRWNFVSMSSDSIQTIIPNFILKVAEISLAKRAILLSLGVGILADYNVTWYLKYGKLIPVFSDYRININYGWSCILHRKDLTPASQCFIEEFMNHYKYQKNYYG